MFGELIFPFGLWIFITECLLFLVIYYPRLIAWFGAVKPQKRLYNGTKNKIAVIIPARNESKVIGTLLDSLAEQTYPREYFDIHVIVADKNDPALKILPRYGAYEHVVETQKCKGDALDACLKSIMADNSLDYAAYLIVDADCLLTKNFVEEMNNALASDAKVILSKKLVKNYLSQNKNSISMSACCNGLIWTIIDDMGNRYKSDHGMTIMTIGTGLMLRADLIDELGGWPYRQTMTEDMELMNDCAVRGIKTFYYSYAVLYMEEAVELSVTNKRRTRWLTGVVDSERIYREKLKESAKTDSEKKNRFFVTALRPVYRHIGFCTFFGLINLCLSVIMIAFRMSGWKYAFLLGVIGIATIYVSFLVLTAFCMIIERKSIKLPLYKKIALLFVHPVFYMGYIPIIGKALIGKNAECWDAIDRIDFAEEEEKDSAKTKGAGQ